MVSKKTNLQDAIDSRILKERKIFLWGNVDDSSAKNIIDRLLYLEMMQPNKEIQLMINCTGGSVTSGFAIYDTIKSISSPVSTICIGIAASMGAILLSAGTKGRRFVLPNARVMIHQPTSMKMMLHQEPKRDFETFNTEKIKKTNPEAAKTKKLGAKILANNCGQDVHKVMKDFETDFWMTAEESLDYGIADGMLNKII